MLHTLPQEVTRTPANKLIEENNKRALELLLRIQSSLEASRVLAVDTRRETVYE